ncbi:hypothetical protein [Cohnella zeiphila]|uniref:Uncharacterized protein n=1 Tax=Cohnella zeiphila TaxID=2761120 RepID=A0A7X0SNQ7_9BACL|nr:hypothetical protein [Cohnella zeiphila]MBB6731103.1 hypothetical protein [Cohnella zeiphila]
MEHYDLASLRLSQNEESWALAFGKARLSVVNEYGTRSWYVDIDGISDRELLERFANTVEIDVVVEAVTIGGRVLKGDGYFHPNPWHAAAAIRGVGELEGYASAH